MTKNDKEIIKREILLAYLKLDRFKKTSVRLSVAINVGLNEAERKIDKEKEWRIEKENDNMLVNFGYIITIY